MKDYLHVHILGAGNATKLPIYYLMLQQKVRITIESRNDEKLKCIVEDVIHGGLSTDDCNKISIDSIKNIAPDIVIIAIGATIKPGQSRDDLFAENFAILKNRIGKSFNGTPTVIVVTNPVDPITESIRRYYDISEDRIFGIGGDLDINRVKWALGDSKKTIYVFGEHTEDSIYYIDGKFLTDNDKKTVAIKEKIKNSLFDILSSQGAPTYGPGCAIINLLDTIINNKQSIHCLSAFIKDRDICMTCPVIIDEGRKIEIIDFDYPVYVQDRLRIIENKIKKQIKSIRHEEL
jgi:malate/lactate dehydrogenase